MESATKVDAPVRTSAVGDPTPPSTLAIPPTEASAGKLLTVTVSEPPLGSGPGPGPVTSPPPPLHASSIVATAASVVADRKVRRLTFIASHSAAQGGTPFSFALGSVKFYSCLKGDSIIA